MVLDFLRKESKKVGDSAQKSTKDMVTDSFIVAAVAFFGFLIANIAKIVSLPTTEIIYGAGITGALAFFVQWAKERGIQSSS